METKDAEKNIRNAALKNGLIWGIINVVLFLAVYYVIPEMMSSYWVSGIQMLIGIGLAVFFTLDLKKQAGGFWNFKQALLNIFIMLLVSMAISYVFNIVLGKFIDPTYPVKMKELVLEKTESTLKSVGMEESALTEAMAKTSENLDKQFSPSFFEMIVAFGISAIFYFVGALILAAIFKKEPPVTFNNLE